MLVRYVPRTYTASKAWPLAVFYHGYVASWMQGAYLFNMTMDAERAGYLLIFAQGSPGLAGLAWEAGLCCLFNESSLVDDIAYTRTALDLARTAVNVDSDRVYAMGWSNGGHSQLVPHAQRIPTAAVDPFVSPAIHCSLCVCAVVERMACEAPELFAGVAVAGSAIIVRPGGVRGLASCDRSFGSSSSLNYLHLHGTADSAVPWDGGIVNASTQLVVSTAENVARWVARLGCDAAVQQTYKEGSFSNQLWSHCRHGRQVELMTVENGQHTWWTLQEGRFQTTSYALNFFTRTHSEQKKKSGLGGLLDVFH